MYAFEKVFEVYVLMSDLERLCPGGLGKALLGFLMAEILSLAIIFACIVSIVAFPHGSRHQVLAKPD